MIRGTIQYQASPDMVAREFRPIVKAANFNVIHSWHSGFLPRHFTAGAVATYGYRKRTKAYQIRKARVKRHQRPLEWSGTLRRNATRQIRVSGTSKAARGIMPGTQVANFHGMRDELVAVTQREISTLGTIHQQSVYDSIAAIRRQRTVRV